MLSDPREFWWIIAFLTLPTFLLTSMVYIIVNVEIMARQQKKSRLEHASVVAKAEKDRANAEVKARVLLSQSLSSRERHQLETEGFVEIPSTLKPDRTYHVLRDPRFAIIVYEKGVRIHSLCVHIDGNLPPSDQVLAKILIVKADEVRLLETANLVHRLV